MKAGIVVNNWKLPIFRERLSAAGFEYEDGGPMPNDTTLLTVETDDMPALAAVVEQCQLDSARMKSRR